MTGARFEVGQTYTVTGGKQITVTKRTAKYISYTGDFTGRSMVDNPGMFGISESAWVGTGNFRRLTFAAHKI